MKRKKTIFLSFIIVINLNNKAKAQMNYEPPSDRERDAGFQLRVAAKHFKMGAITATIGCVIGGLGDIAAQLSANQSVTQTPSTISEAMIVVGAFTAIGGALYIVESYNHVAKAGLILSGQSKFSFGPTHSGIGMIYRL